MTAVHNKASHDCPLAEQQNKEESLILTLMIMKIEYLKTYDMEAVKSNVTPILIQDPYFFLKLNGH